MFAKMKMQLIRSKLKNLFNNINSLNIICFLILLLSIRNLNIKSTKVFYYGQINKNQIKSISVCFELKEYNCSKLDDINDSIELCDVLNNLNLKFQDESPIKIGTIISSFKFFDYNDKRIEFAKYFIFRPFFQQFNIYYNYKHICINYYNNTELDVKRIYFENKARLTVKLFINDDNQLSSSFHKNVFFKYECDNFHQCAGYLVSESKFKTTFISNYEPYCIWYNKTKLSFSADKFNGLEQINSKYDCVNECVKNQYSSKYLFYTNELNKHSINFNKNEPINLKDIIIDKQLDYCSKQCNKLNCEINYHLNNIIIPISVKNLIIIEIEPTYRHLISQPLFSRFSFWLHFLSLFGCIFGVSLLTILNSIYSFIGDNFNSKESRLCLFFHLIKWTILIVLNFLFTYYLVVKLINSENKIEFQSFKLNQTIFKLNLCFPFHKILKSSLNQQDNLSTKEYFNFSPYLNLTLDQLNSNTFEIDDLIDNHYDLFNETQISYLFKHKCFESIIDFKNDNKLTINLTLQPSAYLYLTNFKFNTLVPRILNQIHLSISFEKREDRCLDYDKINDNQFNCNDRQTCLDSCYLFNFIEKYNSLPFYLIGEDFFDRFKNLTFLDLDDKDLKIECENKFNLPDCMIINYHRSSYDEEIEEAKNQLDKQLILNRPSKGINNLIYKSYNWSDLFIDLFNLYSCFGLITILISGVQFNRTNYIITLIVKIICILLFMIHFFMILINLNDVFESRYFRNGAKKEDLPTINICFNLTDELIKSYFNLTINSSSIENGYQLENETFEIRLENIIDKIEYLNKNYDLKTKEISELRSNVIDETLEFSYFYILNKKCLSFKYLIDLKHIRLHLLEYVLSIKFIDKLDHLNYELFPFHQYSEFEDLNQFKKLQFNSNYKIEFVIINNLNYDFFDAITFRSIEKMKFEFLRLFNQSSIYLPITDEYLLFKINDDYNLFNQFKSKLNSKQIRNLSNIKTEFRYFKINDNQFNLRFKKEVIRTINKKERRKNFNAFFIEILNCINLWFDICLKEIFFIIFNKFKLLFGIKINRSHNQINPT